MSRIILIILLSLLPVSCAEEPGGIIVMNEETIENLFESVKQSWNPPSHLNLLTDQPVTAAEIPPVPANELRICGTLDSSGLYVFSGKDGPIRDRGSSFSDSVYGMLGPAGNSGNAWFYADFSPETGQITGGRAYLYGFMGGVCDMRVKTGASYGEASQSGFRLYVNGPCLFPQMSGVTAAYGLVVEGERANAEPGRNFRLRYAINDDPAMRVIPADPRKSARIFDSGDGRAWLEPDSVPAR